MPRPGAHPKTCHRCGRVGSHAFRRSSDALYECTTATACRVRARRLAGHRQEGRGRLPGRGAAAVTGPGIAYVIGEDGPERDLMAEVLRRETGMPVVPGEGSKATLNALGTRSVRLIAVSAASLGAVGFRNEFALRCHQPRLGSVPVLVFGAGSEPAAVAERMPGAVPVAVGSAPRELRKGLRRQIRAIERLAGPPGAAEETT